MLTITQAAQDKILALCSAGDQKPGISRWLRIGVLGGGCSGFRHAMQFENEMNVDSDNILACNGTGCVLVDQISMMFFEDTVVDYVARTNELTATGFKFSSLLTRQCGCGKSFS